MIQTSRTNEKPIMAYTAQYISSVLSSNDAIVLRVLIK